MSPSLLKNIPEKRLKDAHKRICLGMGEWTESSSGEEKENTLPWRKPAKKPKLSNKEPSGERWHFISNDEEEDLGKKFVPKNTAASTKWALANFNAWRQSRNKHFSGNPKKQVPGNFLEGTDNPAALCKWLTLHVAEMRKQDWSKYPPRRFTACWRAYFDIAVLKTQTVPTFSITVTTDLMYYIMLLTMYFASSVRLALAQKPSQL